MHAMIKAPEIGKVQKLARRKPARASFKRIEDPVLDVRVFCQREDQFVFVNQKSVIDQDAHGDTAIGGCDDVIQNHCTGRIEVPQKGLKVDARGGAINGPQPPVKCCGAVV
jgi:hypothetical protein